MDSFIVNVYQNNLSEEIQKIRKIVQKYNFISMDTEFPGVVAKPTGNFASQSSFLYQQLRCNVNILRIIQLGLTFSDSKGEKPFPSTWQFNFSFSLDDDMYSQESIELLKKAGLDFERHKEEGICIDDFGDLLITSGLVMSKNKFWVSFHSAYDFAYLVRLMTGNKLPEKEEDFFVLLNDLFINFYDVKYLMRGSKFLKKGLQEIADDLSVDRKGIQHQAGSDSYLTCVTFFKTKDVVFQGDLEEEKNINKLFGLENKA